MSPARLGEVFRQEIAHGVRRPIYWVLLLILGFFAMSMARGDASISSGDARVGGTKAWITSEFALTQLVVMLVGVIYVFFVSVAAGMALIRDEEQKVGELLHSTPLTPGEYVWGKWLGVFACFLGVLALNLGLHALFNHVVPHGDNVDSIGPFVLANYLRPALLFGLPTLVLFTGTCYAVGGLTRQPVLVFAAPLAVLLFGAFFLWNWSPVWLTPAWNRALQFADLTGLRWLQETFLNVDRGVDFYNRSPVGYDALILAQRAMCAALGLGAVAWTQRHVAARARGAERARDRARAAAALAGAAANGAAARSLAGPGAADDAASGAAATPLGALGMRSGAPGFVAGTLEVAGAELRELVRHPGLYLFVPMILLQVFSNELAVGAFDTRLLHTAGSLATGNMNTLTLLVCMLLLFYTTESLQRERGSGIAAIHYATPLRTGALLAGKSVANALVGVAVVLAAFLGCAIVLLVQGRTPFQVAPFAILWGLLLVPTFLLWTAFVSFLFAVSGNRFATYVGGLAAVIATGWFQMRDKMNWVANWDLWSVTRWSDLSVLELDRPALVLNRVMALGAAALFTVLTVRLFARRETDATVTLHRLRPGALARAALGLAPWVAVPLAAGVALAFMVHAGHQGGAARKAARDYWRKNVATWSNRPTPQLAAVDMDLHLDPRRSGFRVRGRYDLVNAGDDTLAQVPITAGFHWKKIEWTMDGAKAEPEDRAKLFVFRPERPLGPGDRVRIGFAYEGRLPDGVSRNGGGLGQFILPSGVQLIALGEPTFAPEVGYLPGIGIERNRNAYDPRDYGPDAHLGPTPPGLAMAGHWQDVTLRVTLPADMRVNAPGVQVSDVPKGSEHTVTFRTDHPVRIFNVVAGRWAEKRGDGAVVYYDHRHPYNVDEMLQGLEAARRWYGAWFAPYPWRELRLSEFPGLAMYAQGPPSNITFSENIGFLTRTEPKANAAFWIAAHESAHQWWPNIAMIGEGPGADVLSEGLAHFSTILLVEQARGPEQRMAFCRLIEDSYANARFVESERPLTEITGELPGERRIIYDRGGWAIWMLVERMGRERGLAALRDYLETYRDARDYPLMADFLAVLRRHAPDPADFDAFTADWFAGKALPQYRVDEAVAERDGDGWRVRTTVKNIGTGRVPVEVAAARGKRFAEKPKADEDYRDARAVLTLGPGESGTAEIRCDFEPRDLVVDPDVRVLQVKREDARARLRAGKDGGTLAMR